MEQIKLKYQTYTINVYHRQGKTDEKIVFLHGGGLDSAMLSWKEVIELMDDRYDIYAVDQLGYGESDKPDITYSIPLYADCLQSILKQLQIEKTSLAGLSLGGGVSIAFSLKFPDMVDRLILVDPIGFYQRMPSFHKFSWWFVNSRFNAKSYEWLGKSKRLVKWSITYSLFGDKKKVSDEFVTAVYNLLHKPDCYLAFQSFQRYELGRERLTTDLTPHLCELEMPVLIVNGEKDALVPAKSAEAASKIIKNSTLHIMKGCKHWSQKERPEEFVQALKAFLSSCAKGKTRTSPL